MLIAALLMIQGGPTLDQVQRLVKAKDVSGLTTLTDIPAGQLNPFNVLKTGGAYDVGRFGWTALRLESPNGKESYFVLSTQLTSEDVGEILLRRTKQKLEYVPETDALGVAVKRHRFKLHFLPSAKRADLSDDFTVLEGPGGSTFLFRMSPQYEVSSITEEGKKVPFRQTSGIVILPRSAGEHTYHIVYSAIVDLPLYAGAISAKEATLVNDYWYPMIARQPAPYDIEVMAPKGWMIVAQGRAGGREQRASPSYISPVSDGCSGHVLQCLGRSLQVFRAADWIARISDLESAHERGRHAHTDRAVRTHQPVL
jgi:hypothetical protein